MRFLPQLAPSCPGSHLRLWSGLATAALVSLALWSPGTVLAGGASYSQTIEDWHAQRIERLTSPTGYLTLVGLHLLPSGRSRLGSSPAADLSLPEGAPAEVGSLFVGKDEVVFQAAAGVDARHRGRPVRKLIMVSDARGAPTEVEVGSLRFYLIQRGERLLLRVKDSASALLANFRGIDRFPVDPRWRVTARLEPHDPPRTVPVVNVLGQVSDSPSPGTLVFTLAGRTCRLTPLGETGESLFLVFADSTSGLTTYDGGRFLSTDPPAADGTVILDFNKSINPPCAFTPYATCPLPPEGNVLPVAVRAGEKLWGEAH